jgi:hypothetical protein
MPLLVALVESVLVDESVFPVKIIPSWFSMLIHHLGNEQ